MQLSTIVKNINNSVSNTRVVTVSVSDDDDHPSGTIVLSDTGTLNIDEGGSGSFDVSLSAAPNADITVSLTKTNSDISLDKTSLTFTPSDFATTQSFTVSAAEDADTTNDSDTITLTASGGIDADDVTNPRVLRGPLALPYAIHPLFIPPSRCC